MVWCDWISHDRTSLLGFFLPLTAVIVSIYHKMPRKVDPVVEESVTSGIPSYDTTMANMQKITTPISVVTSVFARSNGVLKPSLL